MDKHNFKHSKDIGMTEEVGKYKKKAKKRKLSRSKRDILPPLNAKQ